MQIIFKNKNVKNGDLLKLENVKKIPKILMKTKNNKYYTIIIVDPDAPIGFWIHLCIYNVSDSEGVVGCIYNRPQPPKGTGDHRYYCIIYEQDKLVNKFKCGKRGYSKFTDFTDKLNVKLRPIEYKYFVCKYGY